MVVSCPECGKVADWSDFSTCDCGVAASAASRKIHVASLVLSIIGLVFSLLFPLVTYPCSIVGLVMAVKKKSECKTTAALVMCIIGLVIAIINSSIGAFMGINGML